MTEGDDRMLVSPGSAVLGRDWCCLTAGAEIL